MSNNKSELEEKFQEQKLCEDELVIRLQKQAQETAAALNSLSSRVAAVEGALSLLQARV